MSKPKDFSQELADVSQTVTTDVDAIVKLVRQKDARAGAFSEKVAPSTKPVPAPNPPQPQARNSATQRPPSSRNRQPSKPQTTGSPPLSDPVILENVTTRLRRDTNELLTEATLRQKLKKQVPATRQDIIEEALQDWFRRHGYCRKVMPVPT